MTERCKCGRTEYPDLGPSRDPWGGFEARIPSPCPSCGTGPGGRSVTWGAIRRARKQGAEIQIGVMDAGPYWSLSGGNL